MKIGKLAGWRVLAVALCTCVFAMGAGAGCCDKCGDKCKTNCQKCGCGKADCPKCHPKAEMKTEAKTTTTTTTTK